MAVSSTVDHYNFTKEKAVLFSLSRARNSYKIAQMFAYVNNTRRTLATHTYPYVPDYWYTMPWHVRAQHKDSSYKRDPSPAQIVIASHVDGAGGVGGKQRALCLNRALTSSNLALNRSIYTEIKSFSPCSKLPCMCMFESDYFQILIVNFKISQK